MRAVTFEQFGGPEVLQITEVPDPVVGAGEVLIRVEAAGVCHHDILHRSGKLSKAVPGVILGHEVCGTIEAVGDGVALLPGARVVTYNRLACGRCRACLAGRPDLCRVSRLLGSTAPGGYAEFLVVPETAAIAIPTWLEPTDAALSVCPIGTSVRALCGIAGVGPGDRVLITGASGGLGSHQIQIVAALGARPIAVTSSPDRSAALSAWGAEVVVMGSDTKLRHAVREVVGDSGVDVVIENVTSSTLAETMWTVRSGGTIVVLGNIDVVDVPINPGLVIERRLRIIGSGNPLHEDVRRAVALIEGGMVRPQIHHVFPFSRVAEAHAMTEQRSALGRILLSGW